MGNRDYRYEQSMRGGEKPRRRFHVLDLAVLTLTLGSCILLLLSYAAPWVDPNDAWPFAILGLIAPALYILCLASAFYWVMRWMKYAFFPILVLLLGIGNVSLFFRPALGKHYHNGQKAPFTVMTYNVEGFITHDDSGRATPCMDSVCGLVNPQRPDLLCIQEFQTTPAMPAAKVDSLLGFKHKDIFYALPSRSGAGGWGMAIYSRYPLRSVEAYKFEGSMNSVQVADMIMGPDTVRVLNCHLQTTSVTADDQRFITTDEFIQADNDLKKKRIRNIVGKLRHNYCLRAAQADTVAQMISASPHPVIVCGDFNDTPISYAYRRVRGELSDAYAEKGRGRSNTYHGFFNFVRIDYVLFDAGLFRAVSYFSPESYISDHTAVVAGFSVMTK